MSILRCGSGVAYDMRQNHMDTMQLDVAKRNSMSENSMLS
jgi:hypothetical protein